jgi:hypothetical protein
LQDTWTLATAFDALVQRRGDDLLLQVGVDDDGYRIELGASAFGRYLQHDCDGDDDPLYVLDDSLLDDDEGTTLLAAYQPPRLFTDAARDVPFPGLHVNDQPPMRYVRQVCGTRCITVVSRIRAYGTRSNRAASRAARSRRSAGFKTHERCSFVMLSASQATA